MLMAARRPSFTACRSDRGARAAPTSSRRAPAAALTPIRSSSRRRRSLQRHDISGAVRGVRIRRCGAQRSREPRQQLGEVARPEPAVELMHQDLVPAVAAGAGRAGQGEQIGIARNPGGRPRLQRRAADLAEADHPEQLAEPGNGFSTTRSSASGVTSRPVTPVPPVVITTSTRGSSIHWRSRATIRSSSSGTSARSASSWPALTQTLRPAGRPSDRRRPCGCPRP